MVNKNEIMKLLFTLITEKEPSPEEPQLSEYVSQYQGKYCIFRTYSMGVYFGKLKTIVGQGFQGSIAIIKDARIIHSWDGAKTTLDIANNGISRGNLSGIVPEIEINGLGATIPCSDKSKALFLSFPESEHTF
jgi:hypothetical protein